MISMVEDKMPHAHIFSPLGRLIPEKLDKESIRHAYEDLTTAYKGVIDFVRIIDGSGDGLYSPQELIVAGIFITEGLDGVLIKEGIVENCSTIGKRVKAIRKKYGLNQGDFATPLGISYGHISNIEKDKDFPSKSLIKLISSKYEVEEEWIINGIDNPCGHKDKSLSYERSKYIKINGLDMVLSMYDYRVLSGEELAGFIFDGDNGKLYRLKTKRAENSEIYTGSSHVNDRPQKR